jgi:hypothetical protein
MRFRLSVAALLVVAAALSGCSKESDAKANRACGPAPASITPSGLPAGFPTPTGVTYTADKTTGPSHVISALGAGTVADLFNAYKTALGQAPYSVTKAEHDAHDAEVNFAGPGATGQVKLGEDCKNRSTETITIRPA